MTLESAKTANVYGPPSWGETVVLPGQTPYGEYILSVLLKRTYDIVPDKPCIRAEFDQALVPGDVTWGNPMNTTIRYESDFIPYKTGTDVVFNGQVYAPDGRPAANCSAAVKVADRQKSIQVFGDREVRFVKNGTPEISDPVPFETMDLRYERAYGGTDVYSDKKTIYPYPRNPLGRGFVVAHTRQNIDQLELPNLEDPQDLLSADRLCIQEYAHWERQPRPVGFGWFPKTYRPRSELAGIMPADRALEQELRKAYAAFLPSQHREVYLNSGLRDMDFGFFNGASEGLVFDYLKGDEQIATVNLGPEGIVRFQLPGDAPIIGLDIGEGLQKPQTVIHTVMIHMEERQVDIVWRCAVPYQGPDWLVKMPRMETVIS